MNELYTDVMIDIETTGLSPDRAAIIQIAAVKFNINTKEVCSDVFDQCLSIPPHRFWDEETRLWWNRQKKETLTGILVRQKPPQEVIKLLFDFVFPVASLRFWAKPTHFDYSFISSYFKDYDITNPFSYREATDMNSFIRGLYFPNPVSDIKIDNIGNAHNALDDCFYQIALLFTHLKESGN